MITRLDNTQSRRFLEDEAFRESVKAASGKPVLCLTIHQQSSLISEAHATMAIHSERVEIEILGISTAFFDQVNQISKFKPEIHIHFKSEGQTMSVNLAGLRLASVRKLTFDNAIIDFGGVNMPSLAELHMTSCKVHDLSFSADSLEVMTVTSSEIPPIDNFPSLLKLRELTIDGCEHLSLNGIGRLVGVRVLRLTNIGDLSLLKELLSLHQIEEIDFRGSTVNYIGLLVNHQRNLRVRLPGGQVVMSDVLLQIPSYSEVTYSEVT